MIQWEVARFSYRGREKESLSEIRLHVHKGECVLFCGKSGCGKTTMLRFVNGLIPSFFSGEGEGEILLDGANLFAQPMYRIASKVGSVFQNPRTQFFNVDTDHEIVFGMENAGLPPERIRQRLEETVRSLELENLRNRSIFELSGGEKQKIAFASVYAMNPDVFVLDEPSSNLDTKSVRALRRHLQLVKREGKTVLIAEHRIHYLMDLADKIVYMKDGNIARIYTPSEFLSLSPRQLAEMGLRASSLQNIPVTAPVPPSSVSNGAYPSNNSYSADEAMVLSERHSSSDRCALRMPRLELRNISLFHKKTPVLREIDLKAKSGEIIAVVGENGVGKTTFSRALCGLLKEKSGMFLYDGKRQDAKSRQKKSYMVMQDVGYQLFGESVEQECMLGLRAPNRVHIEETLRELELIPMRNRHPNTLSGGEKQRLAVAVGMICEKDILIFDEPTSGLDFDSMQKVAEIMRKLAANGKILFVVTHDYELICHACTRVIHFSNGRITDDLPVSTAQAFRIREIFGV